jgi:hypothetical protein
VGVRRWLALVVAIAGTVAVRRTCVVGGQAELMRGTGFGAEWSGATVEAPAPHGAQPPTATVLNSSRWGLLFSSSDRLAAVPSAEGGGLVKTAVRRPLEVREVPPYPARSASLPTLSRAARTR